MQVAEYWTSEMVMTVSVSSEEGGEMERVELEEEEAASADSSSNRVDFHCRSGACCCIMISISIGIGRFGRWLWFALMDCSRLFHILCVSCGRD